MQENNYSPEELIPIVAKLAEKYTSGEHSSISYEKAQSLMEAVLYCIDEYENTKGQNALISGVGVPAREAFEAGRKNVLEKTEKLRKLYNDVIADFQDYGSRCLGDTVKKEIPRFLMYYDPIYAPQETLISPGYLLPLNSESHGVDAVLTWMQYICLEQQFLRPFGDTYIRQVLRSYNEDYEILSENLCSIVLPSITAHLILKRPFSIMGFDPEDYDILTYMLKSKTASELEKYLANLLKGLTDKYDFENPALLEYLSCHIPDMAARIRSCLENHCLEKIIFL